MATKFLKISSNGNKILKNFVKWQQDFQFSFLFSIVHRDSKLVVGSGDGKLYLFNWREFGLHSDQFPGHPDAINSLLAVTDNIVITACEDGAIRAVHLYPHRFVGNENKNFVYFL